MATKARLLLLALLILALIGTGVELLLLGHYESVIQCLPLAMIAAALPALIWNETRRSPTSTYVFAGTMAALTLAGLAGLIFHYQGNVAFELEMRPALKGLPLLWESVRGATPALAPAVMIYTGLTGLAYHLLCKPESDTR